MALGRRSKQSEEEWTPSDVSDSGTRPATALPIGRSASEPAPVGDGSPAKPADPAKPVNGQVKGNWISEEEVLPEAPEPKSSWTSAPAAAQASTAVTPPTAASMPAARPPASAPAHRPAPAPHTQVPAQAGKPTAPASRPAPTPSSTWSTEPLKAKPAAKSAPAAPHNAPPAAGPTAAPSAAPEAAQLPVPTRTAPAVPDDNDHLLPVPLESPQLPPHVQELKVKAQEALIERMGARLYDRTLTEEQIENYVITELGGWLFEQDARLTDDEKTELTKELLNDVLRHGPIEPFLDNEAVSEIMVNGLDNIYIERNGKLIRSQSKFLTEAHLRQVIERIVSKVGRRIDESSPMVDARLPDGSRVNAVIPPLAVDGPSLTIRKFSADALTVNDLINFRTLTPESVGFLSACVRGRMNVLVSGGTGTGKTTLLNVLSSFIPDDERIVTLEDAVELQLRQQHLVRLESRPPNVEGKGQVTIRDLVRNSLRMRPDRVIIGECRGGEALDMLQAMNTGHDGSLSTLHANGPRDAIARLETLSLMAGMELPMQAIREQIASAVDLLVHVSRLRDGTRRVTHISEVLGMDGTGVSMNDIFVFDFDAGLDVEGKYAGGLVPTGIEPLLLDKLHDHGEEVDRSLFQIHDPMHEQNHEKVGGAA